MKTPQRWRSGCERRHLKSESLSESLNEARCEGYRRTLQNRQERLSDLNERGTEAITPADLLRHDGDADHAVVNNKLEVTGQILTLEDKIDRECPEITVFPTPAPDAHLESQYEDQVSGGYGEE